MMFRRPTRRAFLAPIAVAGVVLLAAGCGSDDDSSSDSDSSSTETETTMTETTASTETGASDADAAAQVIEVGVKEGELKFSTDTLSAKAGKVTFKFTNPDSIPHDFQIEQDGDNIGGTDLISDGKSDEVTVDLEAGDYDFYCSPHKSAGMTGKLTVA